jgi:hypothetical protein
MTANPYEIGVGATDELSLRVSVATLVRVLFRNPSDDEWMFALERKATLHETENGRVVEVKSQPFGGAIRILNPNRLRNLLGNFHFDSERSLAEQDFRILIQPATWPLLREYCLQHINLDNNPFLETDPRRELVEELAETLEINLESEQYVSKSVTTIAEDEPTPTNNIHARGVATVRVFRVFEATITDSTLTNLMLDRSAGLSHQRLCELAVADAKNGGRGMANGILTLPWLRLQRIYRAMSPAARNAPIMFEGNQLDTTVSAVLDDIAVPRYQRV